MSTTPVPDYNTLVQSFQEFIQAREPKLTNFSEGSAIGMLVSMFATEVDRLYSLLSEAEASRDILLATGDDLDNLGKPFGILRRSAKKSGAVSAGPQVVVTNTTNIPISLPNGLLFWSPSDPSTRFVLTTNGVTVFPGNTASVSVQAQQAGQSVSVAIGQLTANNGTQGLVSNNVLPITGGADEESDEAFRYRITQTIRASIVGGPSSLAGVQLYLQGLPNVLDVILVPGARGAASLDAVILTNSGIPDDDFLTSIQEQMAVVCAAGISVRAVSPTIAGIVVTVSMSVPGGTATSGLKTLVTSLVQGYIDSRTPALPANSYSTTSDASSINYSDLLAAVTNAAQSVTPNISSIALLLSVNGQDPTQGDLTPPAGTVYRTNSVGFRIVNS